MVETHTAKGSGRASPIIAALSGFLSNRLALVLVLATLLMLPVLNLMMTNGTMAQGSGLEAARVCQPTSGSSLVPDKELLPKLVFLAGVEGGGHDFFERVLSHLPINMSMDRFEPVLHLTTSESQLPGVDKVFVGEAIDICPKLPYARSVPNFGVQIAARLQGMGDTTGGIYTRARDPFPMGRIRTPLARPDLISLSSFDGILYNLKVIAMHKRINSTIAWTVERKFHADDYGLQVRLIEDNLIYLDTSLRAMPCGSFLLVDVDEAISQPESLAPILGNFLSLPGVNTEAYSRALTLASVSIEADKGFTLPDFGGQELDSFFSSRSLMWPLLKAAKGKVGFSPQYPYEWPK